MFERRGVHLFHAAGRERGVAAGAIDENVDLAQFLVDGFLGSEQRVFVEHAGRNAETFDAVLLLKFGCKRCSSGAVRAEDGGFDAHCSQAVRQSTAKYAVASGKDTYFTFQVVE